MAEIIEDAGEIPAPLYAWRCYKVHRGVDYQAFLTPLYFSAVTATGKPIQSYGLGVGSQAAAVNLLDWIESDEEPRAYDQAMIYDHEGVVAPSSLGVTENRHGIHSFHGKGQAIKYAEDFLTAYTRVQVTREVVITKIELQGVVIEHEFGYRSEKARIIEIHAGGSDEHRDELANLLGWPFEIHCCDMIPAGPVESPQPPYVAIQANVTHLAEALMQAGEAVRKVSKAVEDHMRANENKKLVPTLDGPTEVLYKKLQQGSHIPQVRTFILFAAALHERWVDADWGHFEPHLYHRLIEERSFRQPWENPLDPIVSELVLLDTHQLVARFGYFLGSVGLPVEAKTYNPTQARNNGFIDGHGERPALVVQYQAPIIAAMNMSADTYKIYHSADRRNADALAWRMQMLYGGGSSLQKQTPKIFPF